VYYISEFLKTKYNELGIRSPFGFLPIRFHFNFI